MTPIRVLSRFATLPAIAVAMAVSSGAALAQQKGGEVIVAQTSNPPSIDAMVTSSQASRNVNMHIYETLFGFDEAIEPIPMLAETAIISDDGLTYRIPLRDGVKFHNGDVMDAEDVKASMERYDKYGATGNMLDLMESIEVTGDQEVTIKLSEASPTFLRTISSPRAPAVIIPAEEAAKGPDEIEFIGTGLYKFVEYVPDSHVTLERFDDYSQDTRYDGPRGFGGKKTPYFDKITFRIMPELGAEVAALETGEVHVVERMPPPAARRLEGSDDVTIYENMPWAFLTFILNMKEPPTDNAKFREAVQVALNMEAIAGIASGGVFNLHHGWMYDGSTYDAGDIGSEFYNVADTERAKALLQEAGYNGEEFVLLTDSTIEEHNKAAVVIAEQLNAAGINAKINLVDWPTALKMRLEDTGWNGWTLMMGIEPYLGPVALISTLAGEQTHFNAPDAEIDALYAELSAGKTIEERKATFAKIQQRLYEIFGIIKIADLGMLQATRSNVKNFEPFRFPRLYDVWFE